MKITRTHQGAMLCELCQDLHLDCSLTARAALYQGPGNVRVSRLEIFLIFFLLFFSLVLSNIVIIIIARRFSARTKITHEERFSSISLSLEFARSRMQQRHFGSVLFAMRRATGDSPEVFGGETWKTSAGPMSTYRKRTQPKPTTAAGLRAQASASGNSIFRSRPRSITSFFGSSHTPNHGSYASSPGTSTATTSSSSYSMPSFLSKILPSKSSSASSVMGNSRNLYGTSYGSSYGGTSSGYGGIGLGSTSSSSSGYGMGNGYATKRPTIHRASSFNRVKTMTTPVVAKVSEAAKTTTSFSKSASLQSLAGSEGYVVRIWFDVLFVKKICLKLIDFGSIWMKTHKFIGIFWKLKKFFS